MIPNEGWSHFDFIWAKAAKSVVFGRILSLLDTEATTTYSYHHRYGKNGIKPTLNTDNNGDRHWYQPGDERTGSQPKRINYASTV